MAEGPNIIPRHLIDGGVRRLPDATKAATAKTEETATGAATAEPGSSLSSSGRAEEKKLSSKVADAVLLKGEDEEKLRVAIEAILRDPALSETQKDEKIKLLSQSTADEAIRLTMINVLSVMPGMNVSPLITLGAAAVGEVPQMMRFIRQNLPPEMVAKVEKLADLQVERIALEERQKILAQCSSVPHEIHKQIDGFASEPSAEAKSVLEKLHGRNDATSQLLRRDVLAADAAFRRAENAIGDGLDMEGVRGEAAKVEKIATAHCHSPEQKAQIQAQQQEIEAKTREIEATKASLQRDLRRLAREHLPHRAQSESERVAMAAYQDLEGRIARGEKLDSKSCQKTLCECAKREASLTVEESRVFAVRIESDVEQMIMPTVLKLQTSVQELRGLLTEYRQSFFSVVLFVVNLILEEDQKRLAREREDNAKRAEIERDEIARDQKRQVIASQERAAAERNRQQTQVRDTTIRENRRFENRYYERQDRRLDDDEKYDHRQNRLRGENEFQRRKDDDLT